MMAGVGQNVEKKNLILSRFYSILSANKIRHLYLNSNSKIILILLLLTKARYYVKNSLRMSACIYATDGRFWVGLAYPTGVPVK